MSYVDETGIYLDDFATILEKFKEGLQGVFGAGANFDDSARLGQLANLVSERVADQNDIIQLVANMQDPNSALGVWLEQSVKIQGIEKNEPCFSTVTLNLTANAAGTTIYAGDLVGDPDADSIQFAIDNTVTVPAGTTVSAAATAIVAGATEAEAGMVTKIITPRYGWASVTNPAAALIGAVEEAPGALRRRADIAARRTGSNSLPALYTALANIDGVQRLRVYHNTSADTDINGVPGHSVWCIVQGGDSNLITQTIFSMWCGFGLYGGQTINYADPVTGENYDVKWSVPAIVPIYIIVQLEKYSNYPGDGDQQIEENLVDFFNGEFTVNGSTVPAYDLGDDVDPSRLYAAVTAVPGHSIRGILISKTPTPTSGEIIELLPNELASTSLALINVVNT